MSRLWILILSALVASPSQAGEDAYLCDVLQVAELDDAGGLVDTNYAKAIRMHSARFAVDRKNGVVAGGPFATTDAKEVQVLSPGTDTETMQILWLAEAPYAKFKYLMVRTYAEGPKKPFLGITGAVTVTGICE